MHKYLGQKYPSGRPDRNRERSGNQTDIDQLNHKPLILALVFFLFIRKQLVCFQKKIRPSNFHMFVRIPGEDKN